MESVPDQVKFYSFIKRTVCSKARKVIDLNYPGLKLLVDHNIHAQDLEACRVLEVIRLARSIGMREGWLHSDNSLDTDVLNLVHHILTIKVFLLLLDVI